MVDGMLRRITWKSVRFAGELVVPVPLDASISSILRQPVAVLSAEFGPN